MNLTEELTQAFFDHEADTGNKPSKLRIHEDLWKDVEKSEENTLQFMGASVTLVKSNEDPMGFLRWSIQ